MYLYLIKIIFQLFYYLFKLMYLYKFYLINLVLKIYYLIKSPLSLYVANYPYISR